MSFCAINDREEDKFSIVWDLGRRCTYNCSYCPPHRQNNWSDTAKIEELIKTVHQVDRYHSLYNKYRKSPMQAGLSFTGGEPTVNPDFFKFVQYIHKNLPHMNIALTTNGFFSKRKCDLVIENTGYSTVSYHTEGTEEQKRQVRNNLQHMKESGYKFKVNVMFHEREEYFNECVELCEWFDILGINYIPRVIGDDGAIKAGLKDKTIHTYSDQQMEWFKQYWNKKNLQKVNNKIDKVENGEKKNIGQSIGRPCCGGRQIELLNDDGQWDKTKFVPNTNFKGWSCMIDWYFLYIHQEIGQVWHHQTCQVNREGKVAPFTSLKNFDTYIDKLELEFSQGTIPYIRCPKSYCGCGLCAPKAKDDATALFVFQQKVKDITPRFMEQQIVGHEPGMIKPIDLKKAVEMFDEGKV